MPSHAPPRHPRPPLRPSLPVQGRRRLGLCPVSEARRRRPRPALEGTRHEEAIISGGPSSPKRRTRGPSSSVHGHCAKGSLEKNCRRDKEVASGHQCWGYVADQRICSNAPATERTLAPIPRLPTHRQFPPWLAPAAGTVGSLASRDGRPGLPVRVDRPPEPPGEEIAAGT